MSLNLTLDYPRNVTDHDTCLQTPTNLTMAVINEPDRKKQFAMYEEFVWKSLRVGQRPPEDLLAFIKKYPRALPSEVVAEFAPKGRKYQSYFGKIDSIQFALENLDKVAKALKNGAVFGYI